MEALRVQQAAELVRDTEWTQLQLRRPQDSLAALLWRLSSSPTWPQSLCPSVPGCAGMDGAGETVDDSLNALEAWNAVASASMNAAGVEQARRLLGRVLCSSAHEASEAERDLERCVAFQAFAMPKPGMVVMRGPDWAWGDQDGGPGKTGTVQRVTDWKQRPGVAVLVCWDKSTFSRKYRWGADGCYDVAPAVEKRPPMLWTRECHRWLRTYGGALPETRSQRSPAAMPRPIGSDDVKPVPSPGTASGRAAAKDAQRVLDRAALSALKDYGVSAQDITRLLPPDTPHAAVAAELGDSLDRQLPSELSMERLGGFVGAWLRKATEALHPPSSHAGDEAWDLGNALAVVTAIAAALRRVDHGQVAAAVSAVMSTVTAAEGDPGAAAEPEVSAKDAPSGGKGKKGRRRGKQQQARAPSCGLTPLSPTFLPTPPALHALLCLFQHDLAARIMDLQAQCAREQGPEGAGPFRDPATGGDPHTLLDSLCATMGHLVSAVVPAATALVDEVHRALYMLREASGHGNGDAAVSASLRVGGQRLIGALHTTIVGAVLPPLLFALAALAPPHALALALSEQLLPLFASFDRLVSSLDEAKAVESGDRLSFATALPEGPGVGKRADSGPSSDARSRVTTGSDGTGAAASWDGDDGEGSGKGAAADADAVGEEEDSGSDEDWAFVAAPNRREAPMEDKGDRAAVLWLLRTHRACASLIGHTAAALVSGTPESNAEERDHAPWLKRAPLASGLYDDGEGGDHTAQGHGMDTAFTRAVVGNSPLEAGETLRGAADALVQWLDGWRPHPLARGRLGLQRAEHAMVGALVHHAGCAAEVEEGCRAWASAEGGKGPRPGPAARQMTQALGDGRTRLHRAVQSIRAAQGEGDSEDSEEALTARVVARASFLLRVYPAVGAGQTEAETQLRRDALETCLLLLVAPPELDVGELEQCMKDRAQRATMRVEGFNLLLRAMAAAASPGITLSLVGPLRRALRGKTQAALAPAATAPAAEAGANEAGAAESAPPAPPAPPTLQRQRSLDEGGVTHVTAAQEVRHHYWKGLEGAGAALLQQVRDVFSDLLRALVARLRLALHQLDVRAFSLLCWTVDLDYGPHDFGLLHDLGLQDLLLAACAPDTAEKQLSAELGGQGTRAGSGTRAWQLWPVQHVRRGLQRGFLRPDQVIAHLRSAPDDVLSASSRRSLGIDGGAPPQSREEVLTLFLATSRLIFVARAGGTERAERAVVSIQRVARGMLTRRLVGLHRDNSGELALSESAPIAVARAFAQSGASDGGEGPDSPRSVAEAAAEMAEEAGRAYRGGSEALDLVAPPSSALSLEARASEDVEGEGGETELAHAEAATARATARTLAALAGGTKYAASRAILDVAWTLTQRLALRAARASSVVPRPVLPSTLQSSPHWGVATLRHSVRALLRDVELLVPLIETTADARAGEGALGSPPRSGRSTQLVEARAHRVLLALATLGTQEAAARELADPRALRVFASLALRGSQRLTRASLFALRCVARYTGPADLDAAVSAVQEGVAAGDASGPFLRWCWAVVGRGVGCSGTHSAGADDLPHALGVRGWGVGTECVGRAADVLAFLRTVLALELWRGAITAAAVESLNRWHSVGAEGADASARAVRDIAATFALLGGFSDTLRTGAHVTLPKPGGGGGGAGAAPRSRAAAPDAHASTHVFPARLRALLSPQPEAVVVRYCEGDSHALVRFRSGRATQLVRASTLRAADEVPAWPGMLGDADALVAGTLHAAGALFASAPAPAVLAAAARPEALTPEGRGSEDPPSQADLSLSCALTAAVRATPMLLLHGPTARHWMDDAASPAGRRPWGGDRGLLPALVAFAATPAPLPWLPTLDDALRRASIAVLRHGDAARGECLLWSPVAPAPAQHLRRAQGGEPGADAASQDVAMVAAEPAPTPAPAAPGTDLQPLVAQMAELGIDRDMALAALDMYAGDVEEAVDAVFTRGAEVTARARQNAAEQRSAPAPAPPPARTVASSAGPVSFITRVDEPTARAREARAMAGVVGQSPLLCYFALMHKGEDVNAATNWLLDEGQRYVQAAEEEEKAAAAEVAALREGRALGDVGAGGASSGELDEQAILRELKEEIGPSVEVEGAGAAFGAGAAQQTAPVGAASNVDRQTQGRINGLRGQIRDLEIVSRNHSPERRATTQRLIQSLRSRIQQLQGGYISPANAGDARDAAEVASPAPGASRSHDVVAGGSGVGGGGDDEAAVWHTEGAPPQWEPCSLLWRYGLACGTEGDPWQEAAASGSGFDRPPAGPPELTRDASTSSDAFGHGADTPWRTARDEGRGLTSPSSIRLSTLTRQQSHGESEARQAGQRARTAGRLRAEVELEPVHSVAELTPGSAVTLTQAHGALRRLHGLTGTVVRPGRGRAAVVVRLEDPETGASILHTLALSHLRCHGRLLGVRVQEMHDLRSIAVHAHTTAAVMLARLIPAALLAVNTAGSRAASSSLTRATVPTATAAEDVMTAETHRLVSAFRGLALPVAQASAAPGAGEQAGHVEPLNSSLVDFYRDLIARELRRPAHGERRSEKGPSLHTSRGLAQAAGLWRQATARGGEESAAEAAATGRPLREGLVLECAAHLLGGASSTAAMEVDPAARVVVHETPHPLLPNWSHRETVCMEGAASVAVVFSDRCHLPKGCQLLVYGGPRPMGDPVAICKGKGPWPPVMVEGDTLSYNFQCPSDLPDRAWGWRMLVVGAKPRRKRSESDVATAPSLAWGQWLLRFLLDALGAEQGGAKDAQRNAAGAAKDAGAAPEAATGDGGGESLALVVTLLVAYLLTPRAPGKAGTLERLAHLATQLRGREAQAVLKAVSALEAPVSKSMQRLLEREGVDTSPTITPARQAVKQALRARGVSSLAELGQSGAAGVEGAVPRVTSGPLANPQCATLPPGLTSAVRLVVSCARLRQAVGPAEGDASRCTFVTLLVDFLDIAAHLRSGAPLADRVVHRVMNVVRDTSGDPRKGRRAKHVTQAREQLHAWNAALDSDLREWVERFAHRHSLPVLGLVAADVPLGEEDRLRNPELAETDPEARALRLALLQLFNGRLARTMGLIPFDRAESGGDAGSDPRVAVQQCAGAIFFDVKHAVVQAQLARTKVPSHMYPRPGVTLDNAQAFAAVDKGQRFPSGRDALWSVCTFAQLFLALRAEKDDLWKMPIDERGRLFGVTYSGEEGLDWGGLYRDAVERACADVCSTHFDLFVPAPNAKAAGEQPCSDAFVPNPRHTSPPALQRFEFLGKILGAAIRLRQYLPLHLAPLVWRALLGNPLREADLEEVDTPFIAHMRDLRAEFQAFVEEAARELGREGPSQCSLEDLRAARRRRNEVLGVDPEQGEEGPDGTPLSFTVSSAAGEVVELLPQGARETVTRERLSEYAALAVDRRLHEFDAAIQALRRGLTAVVPGSALTPLTWRELELLVCGDDFVSVARLRSHATYQGWDSSDPVVQRFWRVMESLSQEDLVGFVRLTWGRSRLPREDQWPDDTPFKLTKNSKGDEALPLAHACFFQMELPQYSSEGVMRRRLLAAINYGGGEFAIG